MATNEKRLAALDGDQPGLVGSGTDKAKLTYQAYDRVILEEAAEAGECHLGAIGQYDPASNELRVRVPKGSLRLKDEVAAFKPAVGEPVAIEFNAIAG